MRARLLYFFTYFLTKSYAYDEQGNTKSFYETFMAKEDKTPWLSSLKFLNSKYQRALEPKQEMKIPNIISNYTVFPKNYLEEKISSSPALLQSEHHDEPKVRVKKVLPEFWKLARKKRSANLNETNTKTEHIKAAVSEDSSASKAAKSGARSLQGEERRAAVTKPAAKKGSAKTAKTNSKKHIAARSKSKTSNKIKHQDTRSRLVKSNQNNNKQNSRRKKHSSKSKASNSNKNKKKRASKSKKHSSKTKAKNSNKNKAKRGRRTERETNNKAATLKGRRSNNSRKKNTVQLDPDMDTPKAAERQVDGGHHLIEARQFLPEAGGRRFRRLIAARETTIDDYPYVVSIQKDGRHWCSGALLNQRLVITTANCVWKADRMSRMKIRACSNRADSGGQVVRIAEVMKHPQWSIRKGPDYDVALLLTDGFIRFSHACHAVDLPNRGMMPVFEDAWVTSWGADRRDGVYVEGHPTSLQVHHVRLMDREACNNITMRFGVLVTENFICFAQTGRRAPCTRDTGAPAVSDGVLWGLASWGLRKRCGTERYPAMYSYVASPKNMEFIMTATHHLMSEERLSPFLDRYTAPKPEPEHRAGMVVKVQEAETTTEYEEIDLHLRSDKVVKNAQLPRKPLHENSEYKALRRDFFYNEY